MSQPANTPVFPTSNPATASSATNPYLPSTGMKLRDYFAGQALVGLLADTSVRGDPDNFAAKAYRFADAMLIQRE